MEQCVDELLVDGPPPGKAKRGGHLLGHRDPQHRQQPALTVSAIGQGQRCLQDAARQSVHIELALREPSQIGRVAGVEQQDRSFRRSGFHLHDELALLLLNRALIAGFGSDVANDFVFRLKGDQILISSLKKPHELDSNTGLDQRVADPERKSGPAPRRRTPSRAPACLAGRFRMSSARRRLQKSVPAKPTENPTLVQIRIFGTVIWTAWTWRSGESTAVAGAKGPANSFPGAIRAKPGGGLFHAITVANASSTGAAFWGTYNNVRAAQIASQEAAAEDDARNIGGATAESTMYCECTNGNSADCFNPNCGGNGPVRIYTTTMV